LGVVDLKALREEVRKGADSFVFQWVNSITGIIQPIESIAQLANEVSATLHVDAAQAYGRFKIDVETISFDSLTITAHKIHGPQGSAALFLRKPQNYEAFVFGGQQENGLRGGTHNVIGIAGFGQAVEDRFVSFKNVYQRILRIRNAFEELLLEAIPEVTIQGKREKRVINTSCITFPGADGIALMAAFDQEGLICSQTSACRSRKPEPSPALKAMGLSEEEAYATLRFSMSQLNTFKEVSEAVNIITQVYQNHIKKERASA
jgi:cysteine desulfurase